MNLCHELSLVFQYLKALSFVPKCLTVEATLYLFDVFLLSLTVSCSAIYACMYICSHVSVCSSLCTVTLLSAVLWIWNRAASICTAAATPWPPHSVYCSVRLVSLQKRRSMQIQSVFLYEFVCWEGLLVSFICLVPSPFSCLGFWKAQFVFLPLKDWFLLSVQRVFFHFHLPIC